MHLLSFFNELSHGIDFITMHCFMMDMDTKAVKESPKPRENTGERKKEETFSMEENIGQTGERAENTSKVSDDENEMKEGKEIQGDQMDSSASVKNGGNVRQEPKADEEEQGAEGTSSDPQKAGESVSGEEGNKNDCDKTSEKEGSAKDVKLEKDNKAKAEGPLRTSNKSDSNEKVPSLSGTDGKTDSKLLDSSEIEKDSDLVANGFEVIPEDSVHIPFTHYVDHKNLTHSGKSDSYGATTENEHELIRLLKLYKHSNKDLKDFHRRNMWGTHDSIRGQLWVRVCETLHKAKGNLYDDYEKDLFHQRNTDNLALPSFVDFNNLTSYHLSEQGTKTVAKILAVIQNTNPEILYCPTLYAKLSIFLHYMGPSDAFNCIYALLRSKDANIMQTKVAVEASKLVLRDLTKKYAKSAYVYLVRNCSDVTSVFDSWMWWLFSDLPFPHIVKIVDCYLVEGVKVLYRIVLSVLILFTKYSVSAKQHGVIGETLTVGERIQQFCTNMPFSIEKLMRRGFRIRGLTKKEIKKLQLRHEMSISSQHHLQHELQKSASSHSFGLPHSHSFSGRIVFDQAKSSIITNNEMPRSRSLGLLGFSYVDSLVVIMDDLYAIWSWLPARYAVCQPELLYTSEEHGTSLRTLYTRIENHQPTLILIKTTTDEVFGAFCSMYWRERTKSNKNVYYFGTGETFVFTLTPERKKYEWVGLHEENIPNTANMFLAGDSKILTVGGGNGEALQLDENLLHCRTEHCDTFDNPPLCSNQDFTCKVVEVYGFQ